MTVQQPTIVHHRLPWWLELVGAAMIGAALLFGALLVADSGLLPSTSSAPTIQQIEQVRPLLGK